MYFVNAFYISEVKNDKEELLIFKGTKFDFGNSSNRLILCIEMTRGRTERVDILYKHGAEECIALNMTSFYAQNPYNRRTTRKAVISQFIKMLTP